MSEHNLFFFPKQSLHGEEVVIKGAELRHITNVLRRRKGERVVLTDGKGHQYQAEIADIQKSKMVTRILEKQHMPRKVALQITVGFVPVKGLRNDTIIEKCTELGVARFVLFSSEYSVVRNLGEQKIERFNKIAQSAMVQSQQYYMPEIHQAKGIEEMLRICEDHELVLVADPRGNDELPPGISKVLIVIGPEGGFTDAEMDLFTKHGALRFGLGATRLRSETAAIVGVTKILVAYNIL